MKVKEYMQFVKRLDIKKVRILLSIVALIGVGAGVQLLVNYAFRDESKMLHAFAAADAKVVESKLTLVGNFGEKYMTAEDKNNMIDYVTKSLNITDTLQKEEVRGASTTTVMAQRQNKKAHAEIELVSVDSKKKDSSKKTNQYLYVTVALFGDASKILEYKGLVEKAYEELGIKEVNSSVMLQGTYDKELTTTEKNAIVDKMLNDLQAKVVRENRTSNSGNAYTVYAYTPVIDDYISVEQKRINLNVVFTHDASDKTTTLYVATPILNTDY